MEETAHAFLDKMAFFRFLLLLVVLLVSLGPISSTDGASDLIQQTCKSTQYYDLCVSSLQSDSSSRTEVDAKGLALIMVNVGMANATATSSYLASQMMSGTSDVSIKRAMKQCAEKYVFANEALQHSVAELNNERYDYAYMHVMAAADYPSGCRLAFKKCSGLAYPTQLADREEGLKNICGVILGIVDSLGF